MKAWSLEEWREWQKEDPTLRRVMEILSEDRVPGAKELEKEEKEVQAYLHLGKCLRLVDGVLVKEVYNPVCEGLSKEEVSRTDGLLWELCIARVIPGRVRLALFRLWHGRVESGHQCDKRIYPLMRERFFWMGMARDVRKWSRACESCQKVKSLGKHATKMAMKVHPVGRPMERLAVDVMGPWPTTVIGNRFIVVFQDYFSNWIEVFALRRHDAVTVANILVNEVISRYGMVLSLHSDQGTEFGSAVFRETCRRWGVRKTRTAPYTPWSNGKVERVNQTVKTMVKHYVQSSNKTWDRFLPMLRMAYNFTKHGTTKCTPFRLMFSQCREPTLPLDLVYGTYKLQPGQKCPLLYCEEQNIKAQRVFDVVRKVTKQSIKTQKADHDKRAKVRVFQPGELVLREYPPEAKTKLGNKYTGPWIVMGMVDTHNVEICRGGNPVVVHVNCLKPFKKQEENEEVNS